MKAKNSAGNWGENKAALWLQESSFRIIRRNYRIRSAEIDIIAEKEGTLYFFEVKTRNTNQFGEGFEAVTRAKLKKISSAAEVFCAEENLEQPARFGVISIKKNQENSEIELLYLD